MKSLESPVDYHGLQYGDQLSPGTLVDYLTAQRMLNKNLQPLLLDEPLNPLSIAKYRSQIAPINENELKKELEQLKNSNTSDKYCRDFLQVDDARSKSRRKWRKKS